jgi:hypothetical protein
MQLMRYLQRWVAAAKAPPGGRGDWLCLFAFCFGLGFLLAALSVLGVTMAMPSAAAVLAKSIASVFCVSPLVTKNTADS